MKEKKCAFCGESLEDWAQEHDIGDCAFYLKLRVAQLEKMAREIQGIVDFSVTAALDELEAKIAADYDS